MTIPELREKTIRELGYTTWLGKPKEYIDLTPQEQVNVTWAMKRYIAANPAQFETRAVEIATNSLSREPGTPQLADTSFGASVADFGAEFVNQAEAINPLSEQNRAKTALGIWGILLTAAAIFAAVVAFKTRPGQ